VASCSRRYPNNTGRREKAMEIRTKTRVANRVIVKRSKRSPSGAQVALRRAAIGAMGLGAKAVGATPAGVVAIGALAIRALAVKRGKIERLNIEELEVGRLHVIELVVEQEQRPGPDTQ
jgi:hypothetical protein